MLCTLDAHMTEPPGSGSPYDVESSVGGNGLPPLGVRLVALPFLPSLWRRCADSGVGWIVVQLTLLVLLTDTLLAFRVGDAVESFVRDAADYYEQNGDPVVWQDGAFHLDGDRTLFFSEDGTTILIDPEYTIDESEIETDRYVVLRSDRVIVDQPGQYRELSAEDIGEMIGTETVRMDAAWVRNVVAGLAGTIVAVSYAGSVSLVDLISCFLYALIAGGLIRLFRGQWIGLDYGACFRIALGASALTVVLDFALSWLEVGLGPISVLVWPVVTTLLGLLALRSDAMPRDAFSA